MANKNILVVEDNHAILDVITMILEGEAFNVTGLNTGLEFISYVETHCPDVIIMDIMLPDVDGRILLKELRNIPIISYIPVLMISARYNLDNYAIDGLVADEFLAKPFDIDELMGKIRLLLNKNIIV